MQACLEPFYETDPLLTNFRHAKIDGVPVVFPDNDFTRWVLPEQGRLTLNFVSHERPLPESIASTFKFEFKKMLSHLATEKEQASEQTKHSLLQDDSWQNYHSQEMDNLFISLELQATLQDDGQGLGKALQVMVSLAVRDKQ